MDIRCLRSFFRYGYGGPDRPPFPFKLSVWFPLNYRYDAMRENRTSLKTFSDDRAQLSDSRLFNSPNVSLAHAELVSDLFLL
jgi:hypothetical protein